MLIRYADTITTLFNDSYAFMNLCGLCETLTIKASLATETAKMAYTSKRDKRD